MSDSSTADVGPVESGVRKLSELRVIDLKAELKRRNLDISGNKGLLSERLKKASGTPNISNHLATLCCKNMLCMHKLLGWMFTAVTLTLHVLFTGDPCFRFFLFFANRMYWIITGNLSNAIRFHNIFCYAQPVTDIKLAFQDVLNSMLT